VSRAIQDLKAAIALTRFGLGARPGEISLAAPDPEGWLEGQIVGSGGDLSLADSTLTRQRLSALFQNQAEEKVIQTSGLKPEQVAEKLGLLRKQTQAFTAEDFLDRIVLATRTPHGFRERWSLFWCNHLSVSAIKPATAVLCGPYDREAIRPHVFGRFERLLTSSIQHPAMLHYLDQTGSIGPNSVAAVRLRSRASAVRDAGLNENLAREILELHTVGVNGGYGQPDVVEFAKCLTGWTVGAANRPEQTGRFIFRDDAHEPGVRTVLGRQYAESGLDQGLCVLRDLAAAPATIRRLCLKLARHFVSDTPNPDLVRRLVRAWNRSDGDLATVATALVRAPEAWATPAQKFKTPYEWLTSSYRSVDRVPSSFAEIAPTLTNLGQRPFYPPSPEGWSDETAYWASPDGLIKRMAWAERFSGSVANKLDPPTVAKDCLGSRLSPLTAKTIARAGSRREALALLMLSPEFQRR
jgi:uncharacterized protein (DUF1800 family)